MTDEEHQARAMLMGMIYHHGNGEPFYYGLDASGSLDIVSLIDANTLEPLAKGQPVQDISGTLIFESERAFAAKKSALVDAISNRRARWQI